MVDRQFRPQPARGRPIGAQIRPGSAKICPRSARSRPNYQVMSTKLGPNSTEFGCNSANVGQIWSGITKVVPNSAHLGARNRPSVANMCETWTNVESANTGPESTPNSVNQARLRPILARNRTTSTNTGSVTAASGRNSAKAGPTSIKLGPPWKKAKFGGIGRWWSNLPQICARSARIRPTSTGFGPVSGESRPRFGQH